MGITTNALCKLNEKQKYYLSNMSCLIEDAKSECHKIFVENYQNKTRGYLAALVHCGIITSVESKALFIFFNDGFHQFGTF